jgi:hypothetical protein
MNEVIQGPAPKRTISYMFSVRFTKEEKLRFMTLREVIRKTKNLMGTEFLNAIINFYFEKNPDVKMMVDKLMEQYDKIGNAIPNANKELDEENSEN